MRCTSCGVENRDGATLCEACGASAADRYAPPPSSLGAGRERELGDEVKPWELKRWRVSGLSWASLWLAVFVPPLGFILSFAAIGVANRVRRRPGNRAVAYAALGTALYMGFIWGVMVFTFWSESQRMSAYDDAFLPPSGYGEPYAPGGGYDPAAPSPETAPADMAEIQRLLDQLAEQPTPTE
jgi:hypothetical protein